MFLDNGCLHRGSDPVKQKIVGRLLHLSRHHYHHYLVQRAVVMAVLKQVYSRLYYFTLPCGGDEYTAYPFSEFLHLICQ